MNVMYAVYTIVTLSFHALMAYISCSFDVIWLPMMLYRPHALAARGLNLHARWTTIFAGREREGRPLVSKAKYFGAKADTYRLGNPSN